MCSLILFLVLGAFAANLIPRGEAQTTGLITQQWLDQSLAQWKPAQNVSMNFQVLYQRASYGNLEYSYNTPQVQAADLSMLVSANPACVRIDIGYAPWLENNQAAITEMGNLVNDVRAAGKCLIIADAASETYRGTGQLTWTQFKEAWGPRVTTLAALYHPDYYIVVKEPGWYVPMVSDATTNPSFSSASDWINLTQSLAADVVAASPNTKVGISVAADSLNKAPALYAPYLTGVEKISNISFLGFDIYTTTGFNATQNFLAQYGSANKDVWIAEAWSGDGSFIYDSSRAQLDKEWIQVLYYFAQSVHAKAIMPFYTDLFASYSLTDTSPSDASQIVSLLQQRNPVYYEYQAIAAGAGTTNSTTSASSPSSTTSSSTGGSSSTTSPSPTTISKSITETPAQTTRTSSSSFQSFTTLTSLTTSSQPGSRNLTLIAGSAAVLIVAVVVVLYALARRK